MNKDIATYHSNQMELDRKICEQLYDIINKHLPNTESKVWHAHPVWFIDGNPIVGYSKLKNGLRLMFWSGQSFNEPNLIASGSFKAAEVLYTHVDQIDSNEIKRYLEKAVKIQWDYKKYYKKPWAKKVKLTI